MSTYVEVGERLTFNPWQVQAYDALLGSQLRGCAPPAGLASFVPSGALGPWTTPEADQAWWWSPARPQGARAAGVWLTSLTAEPSSSVDSTTGSDGCRTWARTRVRGAATVINAEALLLATSCCSTSHLVSSLQAHLTDACGCTGTASACTGVDIRWIPCVPTSSAPRCASTGVTWPAETGTSLLDPGPARTYTGAVYAGDLEVIDRQGLGCGQCGCTPLVRVRWSWRAAPGARTDEVTVLSGPLLGGTASGSCLVECSSCTTTTPSDPECLPFALPPAPGGSRRRCGCVNLLRSRVCQTFDLSDLPAEYGTYAVLDITAGSTPIKNVSIRFWRDTGAPSYDGYGDCAVATGVGIDYLPASGRRIIDGANGSSSMLAGSISYGTAGLYGIGGMTWGGCLGLPCGSIVMCVDYDPDNPPTGATITLKVVQVEPESGW